jgi:agmatine deiminase
MVPDWETDSVSFSDLLPVRHWELWERLAGVLKEAGVNYRLLTGTRDIWVRDFMPVQIAAGEFLLFRYRPDYLQGHEDLITPEEARCSVVPKRNLRKSDIALDGGNVVAGVGRAILTDKVFRENRSRDRQALQEELARVFRAECIFIPSEPGDEIGHADGVVRFLDKDTVLVNDYSKLEPRYEEKLKGVWQRHKLTVERLPYFWTDEKRDGIYSAVGNYVNFLRIGRLVVVPAYGVPQDDLACRALERLLPGASVVPLRCEELARDGGVLNCVSWTIKVGRTCPGFPPPKA